MEQEIQELQTDNPPGYMSGDEKEREILLSQCGTFTPDQRKIFHYLCRKGYSDIGYDTFVQDTHLDVRYLPAEVQKLMTKLNSREFGLITTRLQEKKRVNDRIILTDQGDARFYYYLLKEEYESLAEKIQSPFPTVKALTQKKIDVPGVFLLPLAYKDLRNSFYEEHKNKLIIFSLKTPDKQIILIPACEVKRLISFAMGKLQLALQNAQLLDEISRMMQTSISEISKGAKTRKPEFWRTLTKAVLDNMKVLAEEKKLKLGRSFYQSAGIVHAFVNNQQAEVQQKKELERARTEKMKTLEVEVRNHEKRLISQEELNTMVDAFKEGDESFKEDFMNRFTTTPSKVQLPPLAFINGFYIHRDNIYQRFIDGLGKASENLEQDYIDRLEFILKTNNRDQVTTFYTRSEFMADLQKKLKQEDSFVSSVVDRPQIFSEAFIHTARTEMKIKDVEKIKKMLSRFFVAGKVEFLPLDRLLDISILEIFDSAFFRLPVFKQLFIKVLGRYQSYRERFIGQQKEAKKKKKGKDSFPETASSRRKRVSPGKGDKKGERRHKKAYSKAARSQDHGIRPDKKKMDLNKYTKKDQDAAWSRFGSSFTGEKE